GGLTTTDATVGGGGGGGGPEVSPPHPKLLAAAMGRIQRAAESGVGRVIAAAVAPRRKGCSEGIFRSGEPPTARWYRRARAEPGRSRAVPRAPRDRAGTTALRSARPPSRSPAEWRRWSGPRSVP